MAGFSPRSLQELQLILEKKLQEYSECERCHRVFCSPINYRRHVRVHRGSLSVDKESQKIRGLLAAFWDKLSLEQVKEILAFDDVMLKLWLILNYDMSLPIECGLQLWEAQTRCIYSRELPGSSILNCLASSLRKPGASTLLQVYVKSGSAMLDIIQAKPSMLPISSQELFSILDDASERTFLCAGTAESLQNYVFGGETITIGLDLKNLVACTSFLFELLLLKAWVADKDAETLRCQKLLLEEEEAAQKRQAMLSERKTQKKLRQKELKVKEHLAVNVIATDRATSAEASQHPTTPFDSSSHASVFSTNVDSPLEHLQPQGKELNDDIEAQFDSDSELVNQWDSQSIECLTLPKVWMQKCLECSQEFCSPINYKRHVLMHQQSFHISKESHKNRNLLAAFWDKLSLQQVREILAFDDVMLMEIPGSSVINCWASSFHELGEMTLPQVYVNAGSTLLDIIQAKPSRVQISSQELFSILDDASERTFLCAGTAESLQKYIFDGETAKNSLDLKNLVATISFLFEQQLVKAWVADKEAEVLRSHMLKQEEAAKKRQAMLLERRRQKKLRKKEKKVREQIHGGNADSTVDVVAADRPTSAEASKPSSPPDSSSETPVLSTNLDSRLESLQPQRKEPNEDIEAWSGFSSEPVHQGDSQTIKPPGWPLLTPVKVQMQKCEKCSRGFCSPINYRRHVQVHHRSLNFDKESHKSRDLLAAFWDKLSFEQVKEILTFDDAMLKDIIQAKPSRPPISSEELFSILDEASERTFLCTDTTEHLQNYVFDEETAKNSLDLKNLVAIIGSLFEQKLVRAWVAEKDAEALSCQKLLLVEEEAARRRQAVVLEGEKEKELHRKEQEVKQKFCGGNADSTVIVVAERPTSAEALEPSFPSDSHSKTPDLPTDLDSRLESLQPQWKESDEDIKARFDSNKEHVNQGDSHTIEPQVANENTHQCADTLKPSSSQGETSNQINEDKCLVIIGSIPITLRSCAAQQPQDEALDTCSTEPTLLKKKNASEMEIKADTGSHAKTKCIPPVDRGDEDSELDAMLEKVNDQILPGERSRESQPTDDDDFDNREKYRAPSSDNAQHESCILCSDLDPVIECLLTRWEQALAEEFVQFILSLAEPPQAP